MNESQIKWASKHDWFLRAIDGGIEALDIDASYMPVVLVFTDIEALREWAGY